MMKKGVTKEAVLWIAVTIAVMFALPFAVARLAWEWHYA